MSMYERIRLLDDLRSLLEKQIKLTRQGNISDVEILSRQADSLVEEIEQAGVLKLVEFKNQREQLRELYKDLYLTITAQKADAAEQLNRVRKGKKTIGAYRNNI